MAKTPKVTVLGIGGAGVRVVGAIAGLSAAKAMNLLAVDTDENSLNNCPLPENAKLLAARTWREGRGCGGNVLNGQSSIAKERELIRELIGRPDLLLVLGGLGGGTATGGLGVVVSECRKLEIPTIFLLNLPFTLEGHSKRKAAEEALHGEILPLADAVLCLPNDLLFSVLPSTTPLQEAFAMADREMARTAVALSAVLRYGNLLSASFGDLAALLKKRKSFCSIGVGSGSGEGRCQKALEQLLSSPLSGGLDKIKNADAAIFSLLGGPDLNIGETKQLLEYASSMVDKNCRILVSTGNIAELGDEVHLAGIFIKFDDAPVGESEPAPEQRGTVKVKRGKSSKAAEVAGASPEQLTIEFEIYSKGEMENTTPVIVNGENLDIPAYLRHNIVLRPAED